jgi:hypothetical protein
MSAGSPARLAVRAMAIILALLISARCAFCADEVHDEIQVYNAAIADAGQWTIQQHLNYAFVGQNQPDVPGGFASNHALQGSPELAYGITKWWEFGFYVPFAVNGDGVLSDGGKIRSLFVVPDAAKQPFFYGINFELGYELPNFSNTPWGLEIRPIVGVRNKEWEFIVNPIVDLSFGSSHGEADFAPAVRLARNLGGDSFVGLEYYADFGKIGDFLPLKEQNQQLYAVTDFKVSKLDVELGAGFGFTPGSDRFILKAILGYAFPVPGKDTETGSQPVSLKMGPTSRSLSDAWALDPQK